MKVAIWGAVSALALASTCPVAIAKDKTPAAVNIDAPDTPVRAVVASWPAGVTNATPTIAENAVLPTNTELTVKMNSELNSKVAREGSTFTASVASDVMLGNVVVIPRGTPVNGIVTWRTGKGAFGKSAKMNYEFRSMDLGDQRIPVSGNFRQEGRGNTGAAVGAVVAVGVFGAFVTGKSALVPQGAELKLYTKVAIPVSWPVNAAVAAAPVSAPAPQPTMTPAVATTPAK